MKQCNCGDHNHHKAALTRREILQIGGVGVVGASLLPIFRSTKVLAQATVTPLNTADACIFIALRGAISHMDTFSVKEGAWTPGDWDIQTRGNITLSNLLFPNLLGQANRFSVIHSVQPWVPVHEVGQYWNDVGMDFNAALAPERPAVGAVMAMEFQPTRSAEDVFPGFISLVGNPVARNGFLNGLVAPFSVVNGGPAGTGRLIAPTGLPSLTHPRGQAVFENFYSDLLTLDAPQRSGNPPWGKPVQDYNDFYTAARNMLYNDYVSAAFGYADAERAAYGSTTFGDACIVARNLLTGNRGTRFIHISFGGWDHHDNVYARLRGEGPPRNFPPLGRVVDQGVAALLNDLANTPHPTRPNTNLLDRTLIVMMGEFGRTPPSRYGPTGLNGTDGRDHYQNVQCCLVAGGGVQGGRNIGVLNADGSTITNPGWDYGTAAARGPAGINVRMEDIVVTMYSALGINWTREILDTPSRRVFQYSPGGPNTVYREIRDLFS